MGADDTNTSANYMFERRRGRPDNPDMTCREKATTTTATTTTAAATSQTTTTLTAGVDPTTVATSGTQLTISDVGIDLVWSDDHGLDMRGHCSFTFSVGFCGAFRLELYPEKSLPLPKYEIFIDRDSSQKYRVGIKKYCDPPYFLLCTNNGMGTSGHEITPLVTCNGSTWTPFWISWNEGRINLGEGDIVGNDGLKTVIDPEFKHIDYVKMGADDTNTSANFRFEPRNGRAVDPDMTCRNIPTTAAANTTAATTTTTAAATQTDGLLVAAETTTPGIITETHCLATHVVTAIPD
ncbi:uncharacterized protein LOC124292160 [Haliotis rubra]|uniref:uncharacterized protein LOC124292160 n=1 Tax=Haliotis rubra TaxID=36100 RepID=UPI001EE4F79C|nr:uncharacterized protein LOC124292160 [Haliotis rubra]